MMTTVFWLDILYVTVGDQTRRSVAIAETWRQLPVSHGDPPSINLHRFDHPSTRFSDALFTSTYVHTLTSTVHSS